MTSSDRLISEFQFSMTLFALAAADPASVFYQAPIAGAARNR